MNPAIEVITPNTLYVMERMPRWAESVHAATMLQELSGEARGERPPGRGCK
jgi:hypothetical protein